MEQTYVHQVYEQIASHFSETRYSQWNSVRSFLDSLPNYSVVMDVGCGNGKNTLYRPHLHFLGADITKNLLTQAQIHAPCTDYLRASCLQLPFRDKIADAVICIAVLHHLSTQSLRAKCMQEIARQLVHGGLAHITVWMENQPKKAKWIPLETHGDYFIPWNNKQTGETFSRYYHFFTESELVEIIPENCTIINITEEYYNYCLTIRRD